MEGLRWVATQVARKPPPTQPEVLPRPFHTGPHIRSSHGSYIDKGGTSTTSLAVSVETPYAPGTLANREGTEIIDGRTEDERRGFYFRRRGARIHGALRAARGRDAIRRGERGAGDRDQ